ncbi:SpoIID/LytB domain-containing protein [candidate division WOR-3 bacterium]|nr:SpoIID/LytB domain-containing protein [candidate division WOR-3 bacterium]
MKKCLSLLITVTALMTSTGCFNRYNVERWNAEPVIKVLVAENASTVNVSANGSHTLSMKAGSTPVVGSGSWQVSGVASGLSVTLNGTEHLTSASLPLKFAPDERTTLTVNGTSYRGWLAVTPGSASGFNVINMLPLEQYLYGVVPREIPCSAEILSAVEAQAICARSYAIARFGGHRKQGFDVYSDTRDQAYGGIAVESRWGTEGVNRTRGIVAFSGDELLDARYSSTCGGRTANSEDVWSSALPYLRSRRDKPLFGKIYCHESPYVDWTKEVPKQEFYSVLARSIPSGARISSWSLDINRKSKRVVKMIIKSDQGTHEIKGSVLRSAFGLRSTWFKIKEKQDVMVFEGHGWGHGVGMCQYGAMGMAKLGKSAKQILRHYYKGVWTARLYK